MGGHVNPAVVVDPAIDAWGGGGSRNTATISLGISAEWNVSTVEGLHQSGQKRE